MVVIHSDPYKAFIEHVIRHKIVFEAQESNISHIGGSFTTYLIRGICCSYCVTKNRTCTLFSSPYCDFQCTFHTFNVYIYPCLSISPFEIIYKNFQNFELICYLGCVFLCLVVKVRHE